MERLLSQTHHDYHIFRLSNLAGKTDNPFTVLGFFVNHIKSGEPFLAWKNVSRNILDIEDAVAACDYVMQKKLFRNRILNVANPVNYSVDQIIHSIEQVLGKKGNYEIFEKGDTPQIDCREVQKVFNFLQVEFDEKYLLRTIRKYYAH